MVLWNLSPIYFLIKILDSTSGIRALTSKNWSWGAYEHWKFVPTTSLVLSVSWCQSWSIRIVIKKINWLSWTTIFVMEYPIGKDWTIRLVQKNCQIDCGVATKIGEESWVVVTKIVKWRVVNELTSNYGMKIVYPEVWIILPSQI